MKLNEEVLMKFERKNKKKVIIKESYFIILYNGSYLHLLINFTLLYLSCNIHNGCQSNLT